MKTDFDKNIKIDKNIKKEKNIKMDKNMQAENIHKNVDEITINDFATKNNKDVLELKSTSFQAEVLFLCYILGS